jgi:hypothetical protein
MLLNSIERVSNRGNEVPLRISLHGISTLRSYSGIQGRRQHRTKVLKLREEHKDDFGHVAALVLSHSKAEQEQTHVSSPRCKSRWIPDLCD